jgi:hypothetical protein
VVPVVPVVAASTTTVRAARVLLGKATTAVQVTLQTMLVVAGAALARLVATPQAYIRAMVVTVQPRQLLVLQ